MFIFDDSMAYSLLNPGLCEAKKEGVRDGNNTKKPGKMGDRLWRVLFEFWGVTMLRMARRCVGVMAICGGVVSCGDVPGVA